MSKLRKTRSFMILLFMVALSGCMEKIDDWTEESSSNVVVSIESEYGDGTEEQLSEEEQSAAAEHIMEEIDWSHAFEGFNGAAVLYHPEEKRYEIYNRQLAQTRRSPCSTFKIISSAIALENGMIDPENSLRSWSGEIFWNEDWNRDINFDQAFRTSCVWYFREVIDEIGMDLMGRELDKLQYGNCDISDWEGRLNTNNDNRALTGFWIESSLLISPVEQVEVMERIFGNYPRYSKETQNQLKQVMLLSDQRVPEASIYGKTGLGMAQGIVVDAWFTGFADSDDGRIYFCVYLGETEGADVSSAKAKEIAVKLLSDYC